MSSEIEHISVEDEMKRSYIDYAMSVIVGRALPDARDGLKPVHRRILYSMWEEGNRSRSRFLKCGKTVGNVLGNYHPHGDSAIYDSLVRMAQEFSLRYPLVEGQGNFGSIDGDPPAAYRYTEARMARISELLMKDIEKDTVPFRDTYDGRLKEPEVLPAVLPNLLLNGATGIAVGMTTNIPSHNLSELVDAITAYIDDPEISVDELMQHLPGPDFPTGGVIYGVREIRRAYNTGSGRLTLRGKTTIEHDDRGRAHIIITEIPYQVKTENLIEQIDTVKAVTNVVNEADQNHLVRIRVDIDPNTPPEIVLNRLLRKTSLQVTYSWKMLALVDNQPRILNLKNVFHVFVTHRVRVTKAALNYDLKQMQKRSHIVEGLLLALDHIDEIIKIIRTSETNEIIRATLQERYEFSEAQVTAILNMRLAQLARLERAKVEEEFKTLSEKIAWIQDVLADEQKVYNVIKEELLDLKNEFGDVRRTEIIPESHLSFELLEEKSPRDYIPETQIVIARTLKGYISSMPLDLYKQQHRGGKGIYAMNVREEDMVIDLLVASNFDTILFFTESGKVYGLPGYAIPQHKRASRGIALAQVLEGIEQDSSVTSVVPVSEFRDDCFLFQVTGAGVVKKTSLMEYARIMKSGKRSITLMADDKLRCALITNGNAQLLLATEFGKSIRFSEKDVRPTGRASRGVRGIRLEPGDRVVDAVLVEESKTLLTVTKKGYGKRTPFSQYRQQRRGGKGVINLRITEKNGNVVAILRIDQDTEIVAISAMGKIIRTHTKSIRSTGRITQGVRVMRLNEEDQLVGVAKILNQSQES